MHAWIDLYSRQQTQIMDPPIQTHLQPAIIHKCPFEAMSHRRFMQMKQILYFFDSIYKGNDRK
jgi:hypothetical protein